MQAVLAEAASEGTDTFLIADHSNATAIRFYESLGGRLKDGYEVLFVHPARQRRIHWHMQLGGAERPLYCSCFEGWGATACQGVGRSAGRGDDEVETATIARFTSEGWQHGRGMFA